MMILGNDERMARGTRNFSARDTAEIDYHRKQRRKRIRKGRRAFNWARRYRPHLTQKYERYGR